MSAVTAWSMTPRMRQRYARERGAFSGVVVIERGGVRVARRAYRDMRRAGMEPWDARGLVVLLLGTKTNFIQQGDSK